MNPRAAVMAASLAGLLFLAAPRSSAGEEEEPKNPFGRKEPVRPDARPGAIFLSDGRKIAGMVYLTRDKGVEIFEDAMKKWHEIALSEVSAIENRVEEEKTEKEWRFKEGGNDEKVFTGRTFVDRRYITTVRKKDGTAITGHLRGTVVYVAAADGLHRYFLRQDQRGDWGEKPSDLIYVRKVELSAPADAESNRRPGTTRAEVSSTPANAEAEREGGRKRETGKAGEKAEEKAGVGREPNASPERKPENGGGEPRSHHGDSDGGK